MAYVVTTLTSLAVSVFGERADQKQWPSVQWNPDPVLNTAMLMSFFDSPWVTNEVVTSVFSDPELASLATREGELDPLLIHARGSVRMSPTALVKGLLSSAFLQIYFLRLPLEESTFVRIVLEGYDELRRAARGERIRAHAITGIAGLTLPEDTQMATPWGIVRPSLHLSTEPSHFPTSSLNSTCVLAEPLLVSVRFDRGSSPEHIFDESEGPSDRSRVLFPLACALASTDTTKLAVPVMTWSTLLLPTQQGFWFSSPPLPSLLIRRSGLFEETNELEEWAHIVERAHTPSVDIAARRLVSAVAHRTDRSDALIDAVMVWENLVGTTSEVTFRVTAALAKLIEPDPMKRRTLRKSLAKVYDVRSRVVHGAAINISDLDRACIMALDVAVQALRATYRKGRDWLELESNERADSILLEWP